GQVRAGPAADHDMEGGRRERERDEERQIRGERGIPAEKERRHEVGQGAEAGVAIEEGVAGGGVDGRIGKSLRDGGERGALRGQRRDHLQEIELARERAGGEVRPQVSGEGPREPDEDRSVERQGQRQLPHRRPRRGYPGCVTAPSAADETSATYLANTPLV